MDRATKNLDIVVLVLHKFDGDIARNGRLFWRGCCCLNPPS